MATVLIVEDHANVRRSMALMVVQDGHAVLEAATASDALALLKTRHVDVVVSDVRMPGDHDGVSLLRSVKGIDPDIEVVLATAFGTIDHAVDAIKCGAYDYLTKPVDPERLLLTIRRAAERGALAVEVKQLRAHIDQGHLVARSRSMQTLVKQVHQLAQSDSTVLITGESGTGKELVARALYDEGPRRHGKFVPVNCGGLTESILESELFGHRKGAFTGAVADKKGLLEEADGGVLFLDEIGEMPQGMQVRLLRFLQGGEVRRLGETQTQARERPAGGGHPPIARERSGKRQVQAGLLLPHQRREPAHPAPAGAARRPVGAGHALPQARGRSGPPQGHRPDATRDGTAARLHVAGQRARTRKRHRASDQPRVGRHDHRSRLARGRHGDVGRGRR